MEQCRKTIAPIIASVLHIKSFRDRKMDVPGCVIAKLIMGTRAVIWRLEGRNFPSVVQITRDPFAFRLQVFEPGRMEESAQMLRWRAPKSTRGRRRESDVGIWVCAMCTGVGEIEHGDRTGVPDPLFSPHLYYCTTYHVIFRAL